MTPFTKRLLILFSSLFLLTYVGFQAYRVFGSKPETLTVETVTAYETVETTGLVFRDETVIEKEANGYFFYTIADGNRVAKRGTIANVFPTLQDALGQQELDRLNEEIDTLASINAQGITNRANLSSINQQINMLWLSLSRESQSAVFTDVQELRTKLLALLNKKQLTLGREESFDARLEQLRRQRDELQNAFQPATTLVTSPVAGYFVSGIDGYEGILTTDAIVGLSVDRLQQYIQQQPAVEESASIGKVVGDYEWYMACIVPVERTALLKKGTPINIRLPFVTAQTVPMQVEAVNKNGTDSAVLILRCTHMSGELSAIRKEQVELQLTAHEGLYIPDEAVHFNAEQEPGVYIQKGNHLAFRRIRVLYHDEDERFSICQVVNDNVYVQLYDKMIIKGDDLYDGKLVR